MAPYGGTIEAREVSTNVAVRRTTGRSRSIASGCYRCRVDVDAGGGWLRSLLMADHVVTSAHWVRRASRCHYCSAISMQNYREAQW
jgi:hypothetical protein